MQIHPGVSRTHMPYPSPFTERIIPSRIWHDRDDVRQAFKNGARVRSLRVLSLLHRPDTDKSLCVL